MAIPTQRSIVPFNPEVLKWARERQRRSYDQAAKSAGVSPEKIMAWEAGTAVPTVRQARLLAGEYDRPFLEFLSKEIPAVKEPQLLPDFRLYNGASPPEESHGLLEIQSWAETQRLNALDLFEILGEEPIQFPPTLYATLDTVPSQVAPLARAISTFPLSNQLNLKSAARDELPKILRQRFEMIGILVLKNTALKALRARGLCIFDSPLPTIVFGAEAPSGQMFTLVHELGHIMLQQSAIVGPPPGKNQTSSPATIERWCNEFAAAFLMPEASLASDFNATPRRPLPMIDDQRLSSLAERYAVSRHAMLIRLVRLGYVEADYYWGVKRAQFIEEESTYEAFGRSPYYGSRYRSSSGDLYTGLVLEAWSTGRITNHNAAEFMGIKNITHLEAIRDHFGA